MWWRTRDSRGTCQNRVTDTERENFFKSSCLLRSYWYIYFFSDNNDLGPEGAICIRNLVQENRSIKKLSLRSNGFVDSDCLELFEGIKARVFD